MIGIKTNYSITPAVKNDVEPKTVSNPIMEDMLVHIQIIPIRFFTKSMVDLIDAHLCYFIKKTLEISCIPLRKIGKSIPFFKRVFHTKNKRNILILR